MFQIALIVKGKYVKTRVAKGGETCQRRGSRLPDVEMFNREEAPCVAGVGQRRKKIFHPGWVIFQSVLAATLCRRFLSRGGTADG